MPIRSLASAFLLVLACKQTQPGTTLADAAAAASPPSWRELYASPHFGLYFYGEDEVPVAAVPGVPNRNFDPTKPTLIFAPGFSPGMITRTDTRSFNFGIGYPHAPNVDMIALWREHGWNFGMFDWTQFADTQFEKDNIGLLPSAMTYDDAERRIWARDDQDQLIYHLSDGTAVAAPEANVTEIMTESYAAFMREVAYTGGEIRFYGHSLGTQLVIAVADQLHKRTDLDPSVLPLRVSLTDTTTSNCPKPWLPSDKTRQRDFTPVCLDPFVQGDWIGERLDDAVKELKAAETPVAIDAYRCWLLSSSGLGGDGLGPFNADVAFTNLKPDVGLFDLDEKHAYCNWNYFYDIAFAPPRITGNAATGLVDSPCQDFATGPSASASYEVILRAMMSDVAFTQTPASVGPTPSSYRLTCHGR